MDAMPMRMLLALFTHAFASRGFIICLCVRANRGGVLLLSVVVTG